MNHYLAQFLTVAGLHLLAVISPGPDFILITRNSLLYSRKIGILSAFGLALGIIVHVTYSLIGLAYLISKSIILFNAIKFCGALYLIYIGFKSITAKTETVQRDPTLADQTNLNTISAIRMGFLTNALNPKATLFFLSLFTLVISSSTPLSWKLAYGIEMSIATFLWFSFVAFVFSHDRLKLWISRIQKYIQKGLGVLLTVIGLKILLTK